MNFIKLGWMNSKVSSFFNMDIELHKRFFFFYLVQNNIIFKLGPYNTPAQKYLGWGIVVGFVLNYEFKWENKYHCT